MSLILMMMMMMMMLMMMTLSVTAAPPTKKEEGEEPGGARTHPAVSAQGRLIDCDYLIIEDLTHISQKLVSPAFAPDPIIMLELARGNDHHRVRRLTVRSTLDYGCSAFSAVKECTDLITDCGDVCDNVHAVCTRFSRNSKLITKLCSGHMLEVRNFVENELPKLAQAGPEVEKALREIGDHLESLGDQILNGLTDAFNDVVNWFDSYGAGSGPSDSLVAMVTCMVLLTIVNLYNQ